MVYDTHRNTKNEGDFIETALATLHYMHRVVIKTIINLNLGRVSNASITKS